MNRRNFLSRSFFGLISLPMGCSLYPAKHFYRQTINLRVISPYDDWSSGKIILNHKQKEMLMRARFWGEQMAMKQKEMILQIMCETELKETEV